MILFFTTLQNFERFPLIFMGSARPESLGLFLLHGSKEMNTCVFPFCFRLIGSLLRIFSANL